MADACRREIDCGDDPYRGGFAPAPPSVPWSKSPTLMGHFGLRFAPSEPGPYELSIAGRVPPGPSRCSGGPGLGRMVPGPSIVEHVEHASHQHVLSCHQLYDGWGVEVAAASHRAYGLIRSLIPWSYDSPSESRNPLHARVHGRVATGLISHATRGVAAAARGSLVELAITVVARGGAAEEAAAMAFPGRGRVTAAPASPACCWFGGGLDEGLVNLHNPLLWVLLGGYDGPDDIVEDRGLKAAAKPVLTVLVGGGAGAEPGAPSGVKVEVDAGKGRNRVVVRGGAGAEWTGAVCWRSVASTCSSSEIWCSWRSHRSPSSSYLSRRFEMTESASRSRDKEKREQCSQKPDVI
uniref:Uncharacterized protein n=1 Tax=Oryza punctata TaxID=4537 RepID=A0A0E0LY27_ORYPU